MRIKSNQAGVCPICGNGYLNYGSIELEGEMAYFPWTCKICKYQGEEWYSMNFNGHNVIGNDNNCIEIEDDIIEEE